MALINQAHMYFVRLNAKRPNSQLNKENPTWELQIRTSDPEQKQEWVDLKLNPKLLKYSDNTKEKNEDGESLAGENILDKNGKKQWRVNLVRRSIKADKTPQTPPKVVNGSLEDIDPDTIGNGSIGNISVYQYPSQKDEEVMVNMIRSVQVTKHIVYVRQPSDDEFEITETETIQADSEEHEDDTPTNTKAPAGPGSKPSAPKVKPVINADDY